MNKFVKAALAVDDPDEAGKIYANERMPEPLNPSNNVTRDLLKQAFVHGATWLYLLQDFNNLLDDDGEDS